MNHYVNNIRSNVFELELEESYTLGEELNICLTILGRHNYKFIKISIKAYEEGHDISATCSYNLRVYNTAVGP